MTQQTWLITGSSSGLGAAIAETVLRSGHKVIATARNPSKAAIENPEITNLGGKWIELDVTQPDTTEIVRTQIQDLGGVIDVVVNNAGYSLLGSIEDMSENEIQMQFSTNVYGPVRVLKGVLPFMRERKAGTIVNVGSIAGIDGLPCCAMYAGTKFALEGMSESLAKELKPFGIRVLIVEPGQFRTKFLSSFAEPAAGLREEYAGTPVDVTLQAFRNSHGSQQGDPFKAALRIYEVVTGTGMGSGKEGLQRLILGPDCYSRFQTKTHSLMDNLDQMKEIAHSTSFD